MEMGYVITVVGLGYLVDVLTEEPWFVFSEDPLDAAIFEDTMSVGMVQRYLCWSFFKGEKFVSIAPFPVNTTIGDLLWQST